MRRHASTGLKSRHLVAKSIRSCLADSPKLPYNWTKKLAEIVLAVSLARSLLLKDIARVREGRVKTSLNRLSDWLGAGRLNFSKQHRRLVIQVLKRVGGRRLRLYQGKVVLIVDATEYEKRRSRGKKRRMPHIGKVRMKNLPAKEKILVPGYQEIWTGVLLKDRTCLPITRFLFTEKAPWFRSQNMLEEIEIRKAIDLIREVFKKDVILVGDRGFRRKELLHTLSQKPKTHFIIRLKDDINVTLRGQKGRLGRLAVWEPERTRTHWREDSKKAELCTVRAFAVRALISKTKSFGFNVLRIQSVAKERDPVTLATTLPIGSVMELKEIVWLYSSRWSIETFFHKFKQGFGAGVFQVRSSWKAIDRLLTMAHMAFLVLQMMFVLSEQRSRRELQLLRRSMEVLLSHRSLMPPVLTLGKFFEALAMDFLENRTAWALP